MTVNRDNQLRLPADALAASYSDNELGALIEALLLVSQEPPTIDDLAAGASVSVADLERGFAWLEGQTERGWVVQRHGRRVQLASAPRFAEQVRAFLGLDREAKLSSASLETLAIVAYRQPVTRSEIDGVRGVDSSGVIAKLHARGLIESVGRLSTVGNPIQYGTTIEFLSQFGLTSLGDLPSLGLIDGEDAARLLERATTTPDDRHDAGDAGNDGA